MYIQEFRKLKLDERWYYLEDRRIYPPIKYKITYLSMFLYDGFLRLRLHDLVNSMEKIEIFLKNCEIFQFDLVDLSIDRINSLVYLSEGYYYYRDKLTTENIEQLLEDDDLIELCKINFLEYTVLTQENFIHILLVLNKIFDELPPFALLYLDDKDWYDVLPFESKEDMDKFLVDHRKSM